MEITFVVWRESFGSAARGYLAARLQEQEKKYYDKQESVERVNQTMAERRGMWLLLFWSTVISLARCRLKEVILKKKKIPSMQWYTETSDTQHTPCSLTQPSPRAWWRHVCVGISLWVFILCFPGRLTVSGGRQTGADSIMKLPKILTQRGGFYDPSSRVTHFGKFVKGHR